jgi:GNAT superfamily N-acetyltransferase
MFWEIYCKNYHYSRRLFSPLSFSSHPFKRLSLALPEELGTIEHITSNVSHAIKQEICDFLYNYFCVREASTSIEVPRLYFTQDTLFENRDKDHIFLVRHKSDGIIGTVRYHWIGYFMGERSPLPTIYLVDALCVHPKWRGKHIVEYLLTELHRFANERNIPHAIFLKEGAEIGLFPIPIYRSRYVYRNLSHKPLINSIAFNKSSFVMLTQHNASTWITLYLQLYPETLFIGHFDSKNIKWILYRNNGYRILVGIQNTHQTYPKTNENMGWITVWLEIGNISNKDRKWASLEITEYLSSDFNWIWMDRIWTGGDQKSEEWIEDGSFSWYEYQWETSKIIGNSYGILI